MLKLILSFFIFFSFYSKAESFIRLAETESIFDEEDLIDIESGSASEGTQEDDRLDNEFKNIENDQTEDNLDPRNFEIINKNGLDDSKKDEIVKIDEGFNERDYEVISDKPGYEILTDEALKQTFEAAGEEGSGDQGISSEDDDEGGKNIEGLEELENIEGAEGIEVDKTESGEGYSLDLGGNDSDEVQIESLSEDEVITDDVSTADDPMADDSTADDPMADDPTADDPTADDSIADDPTADDPTADDPTADDPTADDSIADDSMADDPMADDPTADDSTADDSILDDSMADVNELSSLNIITNIRYLVKSKQIVIDTSEAPSYEERVNEKNNQLILEIFQAKLSSNLHWAYNMRDFDTDFGILKADQKNSDTVRVVIQLRDEAPIPPVTLTEKSIVIGGDQTESSLGDSDSLDLSDKILPPKTLKDLYFGDIEFVGEPISFHVIDADVKQVLRFISEMSGMNMVIDESVSGTVTLKLEDVPWDRALFTIFKVNSLGYLRDGNIITILPLKKIEEQTAQLKEIAERQKSLSPLKTKVISIMYGKAKDMEARLKQFSSPGVKGVSEGGRIIVHEESNSLVIIDNQEAIQKIEKLAKFLDYPIQQVMVESKIVEVSKSFARNFGLNWSLSGDLPVRIGANGLLDFLQTSFDSIGANWSIRNRGRQNSFNLNGLPFIGNVSATLNLAESDGTARVLNTTKILVKSGRSASVDKNTPILIKSSDSESVQNSVQDQNNITSTYTSQDVRLNSTVTPTVTSSGSIAMTVNITLSDPGPGGEGEPTTITRNASTEVVAKSGQTIVLSGIYQKSENKGNRGLPLLSRIPFLGFLFNDSSFSTSESEMLMFVTPTLVEN